MKSFSQYFSEGKRIPKTQKKSETMKEEGGAGDEGTDKLVKKYKKDTPGEKA